MTQPEALRLAHELDGERYADVAIELRRLHAENEALRKANEAFGKRQEWWNEKMFALEQQRDALMEAEVERKSAAIQRLWKERNSLREQNAALLEALKSTGLFLHHCWCDVQMNEYSFEKLNQQMIVVDAAIAKAEGEKA